MRSLIERFFGPVFERELIELSRRPSTYWMRVSVGLLVFIVMASIWGDLSGQTTIEELAFRSSNMVTTIQFVITIVMLLGPCVFVHDIFSREHDRRTLELLLITDLTDREIIVGKLASRLLLGLLLLVLSLPMLLLCQLLGGVSWITVLLGFVGGAAVLLVSAVVMLSTAAQMKPTWETIFMWGIHLFLSVVVPLGISIFSLLVLADLIFLSTAASMEFIWTLICLSIAMTAYIATVSFHVQLAGKLLRPRAVVAIEQGIHSDVYPVERPAFPVRPDTPRWRQHLRGEWMTAWLVVGLVGLPISFWLANTAPKVPDVSQVTFVIWVIIWIGAPIVAGQHPMLRHRPGLIDHLAVTPMSSRGLVDLIASVGSEAIGVLVIVPIMISSFLVPLAPWEFLFQVVGASLVTIWTVLTAWAAALASPKPRIARGWSLIGVYLVLFGMRPPSPLDGTLYSDWVISLECLVAAGAFAGLFRYRQSGYSVVGMSVCLYAGIALGLESVVPWTDQAPWKGVGQFSPVMTMQVSTLAGDSAILTSARIVMRLLPALLTSAIMYFWMTANIDRCLGRMPDAGSKKPWPTRPERVALP